MTELTNDNGTIELITLNGFSRNEARYMIDSFNTNNKTRKPLMTSIWFSKAMITNMVNLLSEEQGANPDIDGIRIYYARNNDGQNTVLLVSTYKSVDEQGNSIHQNYFEHDISKPLFKDGEDHYSLAGEICTDNSCGGGARLYEIYDNCNEDKDCDPTKNHFISMQCATEMVWNFGNGLINTTCEWFDIEMFKAYATTRFSGIRIYFAKRSNLDARYPGLDGFVIVTTEEKKIDGVTIPRRDYFDCKELNAHLDHTEWNSEDNGEQCHPTCGGTSI